MADGIEYIRLIKYALLQSTICPSLTCDIFVFIHFIRHWKKAIIKSPHNHAIICLLTVSFIQKIIDVPFLLYYFRWGVSIQQNYIFCAFWNWLDCVLNSGPLQLLAWFCIERHLFVFYSQIMKKKWCLIILHYIPLIVCLIYPPVFYMFIIFFSRQCTNVWDYSIVLCGGACYIYSNPSLAAFDALFHYGTPILIVFFVNLLLCLRIIWQKIKHRRAIGWRRQKWRIVQLTFISVLNLILVSPSVVVSIIQVIWSPTFAFDIQLNYLYYIGYFVNQFLPFVIVSSLPKMHKETKQWIQCLKRRLGSDMRYAASWNNHRTEKKIFPSRDSNHVPSAIRADVLSHYLHFMI